MITERGVCAKPIRQHPLTRRQKREKAERARAYRRAHDEGSSRASYRATFVPRDPTPIRLTYALPEVAHLRLYREGEGNGGLRYTCGPSAMRNMLAALYKRKTGRYRDFGERRLMGWAGTTRVGTSRWNIAVGLNNHVPGFGYWETLRPHGAEDYLAWVVTSTNLLGRAVIADIDTKSLDYFHGHNLHHFNIVYGYDKRRDHRGHQRLLVGEEWSRRYFWKTDRRTGKRLYFNPYGKHWVPLDHAYTAVSSSQIHGIVV